MLTSLPAGVIYPYLLSRQKLGVFKVDSSPCVKAVGIVTAVIPASWFACTEKATIKRVVAEKHKKILTLIIYKTIRFPNFL